MRERFLSGQHGYDPDEMIRVLWVEVAGSLFDDLLMMGSYYRHLAIDSVLAWYTKASWNEVYDALECLLRRSLRKADIHDANAILNKEGSAYRFIGDAVNPYY